MLGFVFQVYVAKQQQQKTTQNIFVHTLQNDLTSGHGRKCFAFQVEYKPVTIGDSEQWSRSANNNPSV